MVVVEFGYSFGQLCKLYPEISLHVDYDGETPLGLNPFDLEGRSLDNNKIEVLSGIVQRFWRRMFGKDEEEQSVALTKFIQDYYTTCLPPHSFPSFYRHVTEHYEDICRRKDVDPNYFDLSSFRLICSEFLPGERYANVCKSLSKELQSGSKLRIVEQEISHKQYQNQQRKAELREQAYEMKLLKRNLFVLVIIFISLIVLSIFLYQWYKRKKNMQLMVTRYNLEQSEHELAARSTTARTRIKICTKRIIRTVRSYQVLSSITVINCWRKSK